MSRRAVLRAAGLSGAALGLSACGKGFGGGGEEPAAGQVELNMVWWGDANRATKTQAALDLFTRANPNIKVKTEYQDSGPYKDKLATRFAAGNPPDLMAMRLDSVREYADRGALLDLNPHKDTLDLSPVSPNVLSLAQVGDKNFGIASGLNTIGFVINKTLTDQYKMTIPDGNTWSWAEFEAFAAEVTQKSGGKVYGTGFEAWTVANLVVWTRQKGEDYYTADGKLGVSEATMTAWFELFARMRRSKGFPPAGFFEQLGSSAEQSYIAKGKIASQIIPTNNFFTYNKASGGNLVLLRMPGETTEKRRGQSIDTPALWSIAQNSKHVPETLKLLNFLINDPEASKATGTTRGVPANPKVAEAIKSGLSPDDQVATDYLTGLTKEDLPRSYTYPPGSSKIAAELRSIADAVEFGKQTPAGGAKAFLAAGKKALGG